MSSVSADDKICLSFQGGDIACNGRCSPDAHGFPLLDCDSKEELHVCWTLALGRGGMLPAFQKAGDK